MLPVETSLHLQLKVAGERVGFNDVAVWARETAGALGQELIRQRYARCSCGIWRVFVAELPK
jgi:hypothetical protein